MLQERGYDRATGLIYDPPTGFSVDVPEEPTKKDVNSAKKVIRLAFGDFPYADQASLANTTALMLTPGLREVIKGPIPLAAVDKPSPGTGAFLLIESLSLATSGKEPGALGAVEDDNEMRKQITSKLRTGEPWLLLDNVELKSASLARVLTAGVWEDRILGVSKTLRVPIRNVWVATGNNLQLSREIARRSYWIPLDAKVARPWDRHPSEFTIPNLKAWVQEHRADVLSALLTIGRYWFVKGQPEPEAGVPVMGSFEEWARVLSGVLAAAGVEGFLENSRELHERATEEVGTWAEFLEAWSRAYGSVGITTQKVASDIQDIQNPEGKALREALPDEFSLVDDHLARRLGRALGKKEGVRHGQRNLHIARAGSEKQATLWAVRDASNAENEQRPRL